MSLDEKTIQIVKSTEPLLKEKGEELATHFYHLLFEKHPDIKKMFNEENQQSGRQPRALASEIIAYAHYIDNLKALSGAMDRMARRHTSVHVQPEHYPIIGETLLDSMDVVLKDHMTPEIREAWKKAYMTLAKHMIAKEKAYYEAQSA